MISKVLSIKVGGSVTRVCLMDYRSKNPKYIKAFQCRHRKVLFDGVLRGDIKSFASALRSMISERNMRTKVRSIYSAVYKDCNKRSKASIYKSKQSRCHGCGECRDYFPVDLANYQLSHNILGVEEDEEQGKKYKIQVLAAPKIFWMVICS